MAVARARRDMISRKKAASPSRKKLKLIHGIRLGAFRESVVVLPLPPALNILNDNKSPHIAARRSKRLSNINNSLLSTVETKVPYKKCKEVYPRGNNWRR